MNVGGVPGLADPNGFVVVIVVMAAITAVELWLFKRGRWFD
jgi:Mg2+ and Co2+ transporter CorA